MAHTLHCECLTCETFTLGEAVDIEGRLVPAYGVASAGEFIVNPYASACLRFHCAPSAYGLSDTQASQVARLNASRNLLAYWDL